MKPKLDTVILSALLLLLAVLICLLPLGAQAGSGVQQSSGFTIGPQLSGSNTTEANLTLAPSLQPPIENFTSQNTIMLVIVVGVFVAYAAVIAVLASRKIK
ncbi:hypothetical protein GX563_05540 [Candidatus Bathyarchaeota archaeon]|nr:hypothetical protein [Candidatus Bathyarchaeota archaeon]